MGEGVHVQISRPFVETSISDPIGNLIPGTIREKIRAGSYIELPLLLKQPVTFIWTSTILVNRVFKMANWS